MTGALPGPGVCLYGSTSCCQHTSITSAVTRHSKFQSLPRRLAADCAFRLAESDFAEHVHSLRRRVLLTGVLCSLLALRRSVKVLNHGGLLPSDCVRVMCSLWPLLSSTGQISPQIFIEESRATAGFQLSVNTASNVLTPESERSSAVYKCAAETEVAAFLSGVCASHPPWLIARRANQSESCRRVTPSSSGCRNYKLQKKENPQNRHHTIERWQQRRVSERSRERCFNYIKSCTGDLMSGAHVFYLGEDVFLFV